MKNRLCPLYLVPLCFCLLFCMSQASAAEGDIFVPKAPDDADPAMWYTADGDTANAGADVFYVVSTWETDWTAADGRVSH